MLKRAQLVFGFIFILILFSCEQPQTMILKLTNRTELKGIPSASGIEKIADAYWVVGDNSPWLYKIDPELRLLDKIAIHDTTNLISGVLEKSDKHDSEAMISFSKGNEMFVLLIGSGSKETRKRAKMINAESGELTGDYDLTPFYDLLMEEAKLDEEDLNIEAAAIAKNRLYLFNRGKNKVISMKFSNFLSYLQKQTEGLKMKSLTIDLPKLDGVQSGFSGAVADPEFDRILFTASVENTSNWIDDGAVLGSFIGIIKLNDLHHHYIPESNLIEDENGVLELKVESVTIQRSTAKSLDCLLVTDSDGGQSEILSVEIKLN